MADIQYGDVTVEPLQRSQGFVYGRVLDPASAPLAARWQYLGSATHDAIACAFAYLCVAPGQTVWILEENGQHRRYEPETSN